MADKLSVLGNEIKIDPNGFINITDIAKFKSKEPDQVIRNWLRAIYTLEFLSAWESLNNINFNTVEYDRIRSGAGKTTFTLSVKNWTKETNAIGLKAKAGRYGGTYAQRDIAFEFCSAISPIFKLNLIREWQSFKGLDTKQKIRRELTKVNHLLLTDAIGESIPGKLIGTRKEGIYYASEMDLLNLAVFNMSAKEWKSSNPNKNGNIRDHATPLELIILSNLEAINTYLIKWDTEQEQRLEILKDIAEHQRTVLPESKAAQRLMNKSKE